MNHMKATHYPFLVCLLINTNCCSSCKSIRNFYHLQPNTDEYLPVTWLGGGGAFWDNFNIWQTTRNLAGLVHWTISSETSLPHSVVSFNSTLLVWVFTSQVAVVQATLLPGHFSAALTSQAISATVQPPCRHSNGEHRKYPVVSWKQTITTGWSSVLKP